MLKSDTRVGPKDFLDLLLCHGLYPLTTKPTRIATGSATITDNTFTNIIASNQTGILVDDTISDHLSIFSKYKKGLIKKHASIKDYQPKKM